MEIIETHNRTMLSANLKSIKENVPIRIFDNQEEASIYVAKEIAAVIRSKNKSNKKMILGLATGSSPLLIYKQLIQFHKEEGLSFKNVITFNLDEYYPMAKKDKNSYHHFMYEHLFKHIDILPENINIPDGTLAISETDSFCNEYDNKIASLGGIDIQVLGIGRSGHIGFNEPGSGISSPTRLVKLHDITIEDAAKDFGSEENVPQHALTMGIKSIMNAKKVFLGAWGESKAEILQKAVEEEDDTQVPASFLQHHHDCLIVTDLAASSKLSRFKTPWLSGICEWDDQLKKKAVIWLSQKVVKPILKLTDNDYRKWGLADLLKAEGSAYDTNLDVHYQLQKTITGWPGGKPNSDDKSRPERSAPYPKRVIIFSPHPDDDVISMGGTLLRLAEQGHEVHVAYQTSGNLAVIDDEALRFLEFIKGFSGKFEANIPSQDNLYQEISNYIKGEDQSQETLKKLLAIKGLIRQGEATAACRYCGVKMENIHFLEMPFYETAAIKKNPLGDQDIQIIENLINKVQPHQIFAAGDLHDPHGTHAVCLNAIFKTIENNKQKEWMKNCNVWLYRGAWHEWDIEDIEMAIPISPDELLTKRKAIFKHQSQKDSPVFPGKDKREFWQRAEDRNRTTARLYDQLGLTEYEAIEAFKQYHFKKSNINSSIQLC